MLLITIVLINKRKKFQKLAPFDMGRSDDEEYDISKRAMVWTGFVFWLIILLLALFL